MISRVVKKKKTWVLIRKYAGKGKVVIEWGTSNNWAWARFKMDLYLVNDSSH